MDASQGWISFSFPRPRLSSQVWAERDCPTQLAVLLVPGKLGVKVGREALFGR